MNRVCAVVVTYNRLALLKQCLEALRAQTVPCDVILVNNASTDDTRAWLDSLALHGVTCLHLPENIGGAGGFNAGMKAAAAGAYTHIWLMDDDTLPSPDALEKLLEADAHLHGEYGWLSSVALWTDGRECRMNRQKTRNKLYDHIELLRYGIVEAEQATFVSLLCPVEVVRRVGLPIREFFIWGDDIEYTRRIAVRQGLPGFVAGQSIVTHAMTANTGSSIATDGVGRISRYNYAFRNENYLYRKEGVKGFCYYFAKCGKNFLEILFKAKDHRAARLWVIVKQFFAGLAFNPKVEYPETPSTK